MRTLVITLLVLAGLVVAVDFGAAAAAEHRVATQLRAELGLTTDPSVQINGFPFLTQALSGNYGEIEVQATGLTVGPLDEVAAQATLYDVDAPLSALTAGALDEVRAEQVDGRIVIRDTDLGRAIGVDDLRLRPASDDEVQEALGSTAVAESDRDGRAAARMVASTSLFGQRADIVAIAVVELTEGVVQVTPVDLRLARDGMGETRLPAAVREPLLGLFTTQVDPGRLPFTATPTAVSVETGALVVEGTARDVTFDQIGAGAS